MSNHWYTLRDLEKVLYNSCERKYIFKLEDGQKSMIVFETQIDRFVSIGCVKYNHWNIRLKTGIFTLIIDRCQGPQTVIYYKRV